MEKIQRDSNIELLRIVAMFLIVLHHCAYRGFHNAPCLDVLQFGGGVGVNIFVLITGYFMVQHAVSLKKLVRLYVHVYLFCVGGYLFYRACPGTGPLPGVYTNISFFFPVLSAKYWFITTYFFLMLVSPCINVMIAGLSRIGLLKLICVMMAFCSLSTTLPISHGMEDNFALFLMLYLIGAGIRLHVRAAAVSPYLMSMLLLGLWFLVQGGILYGSVAHLGVLKSMLMSKTGLPNLCLSLLLFLAFYGRKPWSSAIVNQISACTLGVYLIHTHPLLRSFIWHDCLRLQELPLGGMCILYGFAASVLVYVVCSALAWLYKCSAERVYISWCEPRILPLLESLGVILIRRGELLAARLTGKDA